MYKQQIVFGEIRASAKKKTAIVQARLRLSNALVFVVNSKPMMEYFREASEQAIVLSAFAPIQCLKFSVMAVARGGGLTSQARALKLAITKCMLGLGDQAERVYKLYGTTTTDARVVERKKYGRAKARRSFQFSKR
ncbi:30S ribosomal subunit protein S9 [Candidatus Hodgkinia cicadicola]|nr:30S ribosomal subunit protein S9 [Candidatus Hodgkinia cicadicola]AUG91591.1 30S ribosomal subunit protein S9 [Candidatus Hodgkinia cicadicola]